MKAAVLTGIREVELVEMPMPSIKNGHDVLLKIEMVGVCGSDVHYYETGRIGSQVVKYPYLVGHECAATVVATGNEVTSVKVGDRIVVEPAISCHKCDQCLAGRENTCRNLKFLGCPGQIDGCLCEYLVMPEDCCLRVSKDFSFERAVLCEPLTIGLYAVEESGLKEGGAAAILGAGPIGLSVLVSANALGVKQCYVTDKIEARKQAALKGGAVWAGNPDKEDIVEEINKLEKGGMDVVYECCGEQDAIDQGIELLKPGGKMMLIGIPRVDRISFSIDKMRRKEITIINVRRQNRATERCIEMMASGRIDPDFMVTHRFGLEDSKKAFDLVAGYKDGVIKAMIEM